MEFGGAHRPAAYFNEMGVYRWGVEAEVVQVHEGEEGREKEGEEGVSGGGGVFIVQVTDKNPLDRVVRFSSPFPVYRFSFCSLFQHVILFKYYFQDDD